MARTPFIAGNWKMHGRAAEARALAQALKAKIGSIDGVDVGVAPPFTALELVRAEIAGSRILLGGQNLHEEPKGAFTGEIAAGMLVDAGCGFVIIGHSERRQYFGETDAGVAKKLRAAAAAGLVPIVCVGETLAERESGRTEAVIEGQIRGALTGLGESEAPGLVIAYEPVWAIGTGRTASPEQAEEVHAKIRGWLGQLLGASRAAQTRIQYGGSVKADNAKALLSQPNIDGALVGGASLDAASFEAIVRAAR
ncbi:MAG: triose-phosphate isomerase [bacterium]